MRTRLLTITLGLLVAWGAASAGARDLVIGITQFPSTLHPNIDSMLAKTYVLGLAQRPFTTFDQRWELICMLCEALPTFENGGAQRETAPDGRAGVALTYKIADGAKWGDGTPISVDDVQFTLEVGKHPSSGIANAELYRRIWQIDPVDKRTFTIHYVPLGYNYSAINDFRPLPAHLERAVFAQDPATYRNRTLYETAPTTPGLWFGPYRVTEVAAGSHIVLERNPLFWGAAAAFPRIVVRSIENTAALEANLLAGQLDMIEGSLGLALDQALAFEKRQGERFRVHFQPGLGYEHLVANLDNPILADRRIRQALLHGLDREALNARLFGGRQPVALTATHPLDWIHTDAVRRYPFEPKTAAALLDEAGWRPGPGGIRVDAQGRPLRLQLVTTAGNRSRELVQQVLQSQWRQLGVEVEIANQPPRVLFGETLDKRRFTGLALFAWISSPEHLPRTTLRSSEIPSAANNWIGQNYAGFADPAMDDLIDRIEVELDRERRGPLWHELQRRYAEELPALPLFFRADPHVWPRWLEGVEPTGQMAPTTFWVERWRVAGD